MEVPQGFQYTLSVKCFQIDLVNRISSERKVKKKKKIVLTTSWGLPELTSKGHPLSVRSGCPLDVILRLPHEVRLGLPRDFRSRRPWDSQIGSLENALGTLEVDVPGKSQGPIFASRVMCITRKNECI